MSSFSLGQKEAFDEYQNGNNIFISGYAGTGKSYLINHIYTNAKERGKHIQITAMTGCAAVLLGHAKTLHSWASIGLGNAPIEKLIANIRKYNKVEHWTKIDILVIDEISMMSKSLFELIDQISKRLRKNNKIFGGIQLICSGDFHQLPPIEEEFCFESPLWDKTFKKQLVFKENYRQKGDLEYQQVLNEIREGKISPESCKLLIECTKKEEPEDIKPTVLYPTKKFADQINSFELITLDTEQQTYIKSYTPEVTSGPIKDELEKQKGMYDDKLILKVGCQVMCIANLSQEEGIVNGSQGIITGFVNGFPEVKFKHITKIIQPHKWINEKYEDYSVSQIPLILSWAITIHKAQGITLENATINIGSSVFEYGQAYVALSRLTSREGLYIKSLDIGKIRANPKVVEFYKKISLS
jgi:ATP-dependent DNA helicase PIF1